MLGWWVSRNVWLVRPEIAHPSKSMLCSFPLSGSPKALPCRLRGTCRRWFRHSHRLCREVSWWRGRPMTFVWVVATSSGALYQTNTRSLTLTKPSRICLQLPDFIFSSRCVLIYPSLWAFCSGRLVRFHCCTDRLSRHENLTACALSLCRILWVLHQVDHYEGYLRRWTNWLWVGLLNFEHYRMIHHHLMSFRIIVQYFHRKIIYLKWMYCTKHTENL